MNTVAFVPVLLSLSVLSGCSRFGQPIHYLLPDGFRGLFWVIHSPAAAALPDIGKGWLQVTVPESRVVLAPSLAPFDAWHESSAAMGTTHVAADLEVGKTIVSPGLVGIWIGPRGRAGPGGREYRSFFVGTETEFTVLHPTQFQTPVH